MATRRRRGENGISFEHRGPAATLNATGTARACGAVSSCWATPKTGSTRRKASGTTKAAVLDKLRELRNELDKGIVPKAGYANYTVRQAAQDWLANGFDDRSAKTTKKN